VFGAVFAHRFTGAVSESAGLDAAAVQNGPARIASLPAAIRDAVADGVTDAVNAVFLLATPVAVAAFAVVLLLRAEPLRDKR
jgi:hypothetical protein